MDALDEMEVGRRVRDALDELYDDWMDTAGLMTVPEEEIETVKQDRLQFLLGDDRELGRRIVEAVRRAGVLK
jgi:hypothetical protein